MKHFFTNRRTTGVCLVVMLMVWQPVSAQQSLAFKVSVFCQGFGHTFSGIPGPATSYGLRLGTEWTYVRKGVIAIGQDVNAGWYRHPGMQTSWMLTSSPVIRLTLNSGFESYFSLGAGRSLNFMDQAGCKDNGDGSFDRQNHAFYSPWLLTGSLGVGYNFAKRTHLPMTLFAETQTTGELVKNQYTPIFPHHLFHLGARIPLRSTF